MDAPTMKNPKFKKQYGKRACMLAMLLQGICGEMVMTS